MKPNSVVSAARLDLGHEPSVTGAATTIGEFAGLEVGVWEIASGVMSDVEVDEVFVVVSGRASVEFADGTTTLHLSAGDVVRLAAGAETLWTVTETLRKVYLTAS